MSDFQTKRKQILIMGIVSLFIVSVVFLKLTHNVRKPILDIISKSGSSEEKVRPFSENNIDEVYLRNQDSDEDGLNDYEEKFIYKTSPYIPDTDSDGLSDIEEIEKGLDPICPRGENCYGSSGTVPTELGTIAAEPQIQTNEDAISEEDVFRIFSGAATADEIRALLVLQGADEQELQKIPDEDLLKFYQDTAQTVQQSLE